MYKIFNKIAVYAVVAGLLLPTGVFASLKAPFEFNQSTNNVVSVASTGSIVKVKPVQQLPTLTAAAPINCVSATYGSANMLQGGSQINLNLPSNCYKLTLNFPQPSAPAISVAQPSPAVYIVVIKNWLSAPFASSLPQKAQEATMVGLAAAILAAVFEFRARKAVRTIVKKTTFSYQPGIFELLVLRC